MSRTTNRIDPLPVAGAVAVCVITILVISGWVLRLETLQSFLPGAIGMKLVTATGFFLASAALITQLSSRSTAHILSALLASILIILGGLSLVEEFFNHDFLIDRMWVRENPGATETVHPGRMAVNTAVCFMAIGAALLLARVRSRTASLIARSLLLICGVIAVQVLIGYVFSARQLRTSATSTPMALPTAINFALLAMSVAALRKDEWPMTIIAADSAAGAAARSLLPAALIIIIGPGWLRLRGEQLGWYETATGTALYALANILALSGVTLFTITRLHRIELSRRQDQENLHRAIAAQNVISRAPREREAVDRAIVEQSRSLVDAAGAALAILDTGHVRYRSGIGTAEVLDGFVEKGSDSAVALSLLDHRPAIRCRLSGAEGIGQRMGAVQSAVVPLRSADVVVGAIVVFAETGAAFSDQQLDLLRVIAGAAASALVQAHQFDEKQQMLLEQAGELAVLHEQFSAFMANIPAAAFIKDDAGRYIYANAGASHFFNCEAVEILGLLDDDILPPAQANLLREHESEVLTSGHTVSRVIRLDEMRDRSAWLLLRFPINIQRARQFLGGIAVDITEQKLAEEQIAQLNASLELRVAARTEELQRANAELEAFTYSVSHDLRSPLRAVNGYSKLLEEGLHGTLDDESRRFLTTIRSEAQRMGTLIDDLLSFSRIGRQAISPGTLDVAELAAEVFQEVRRLRPERTLEFIQNDLPLARADRSLMRQVLVNLLSNAAKYSKPEGTIRIEMGGTAGDDFNTYWVRDSGVGFDMRYADKLFGVFQRLHSAEEFEGTGVGLAIVERIVTRHFGRVWAEAAVGKGACFYFTLPAAGSSIFDMTGPPIEPSTIPRAEELQENLS